MDEATPTPGTRSVWQPTTANPRQTDLFGYVRYTFTLIACSTAGDPYCERANAPTNWTYRHHDIAVIDPLPIGNFNAVPHNTPRDTDLTRHLQRSATSYINGPSGKIIEAGTGYNHLVWGAVRELAAHRLAQHYGGDPPSAGRDPTGRLAGFTNQEPAHTRAGRQPYVLAHDCPGTAAPSAAAYVERIEQRLQEAKAQQERQREQDRQRAWERDDFDLER